MGEMSGLNKFMLALFLAAAGYGAWGKYHQKLFPLQPLYQKPYIVVYGRESCGNCRALRLGLEEGGVPYVWKLIDKDPARAEAFSRMKQAELDIKNFQLPVVDVNAEILVHPEYPVVIAKYRL